MNRDVHLGNAMQKITAFLWFDDKAEEAVNFYTSIFENSKILSVTRYGEEGAKAAGRSKGSVMTVVFELEGQEFIASNGGPVFTFSPAISFLVKGRNHREAPNQSYHIGRQRFGKISDLLP
jgi:predicted 3-demethylubiquinone-9 3-methyltransferase (glyoxalase superfamily)